MVHARMAQLRPRLGGPRGPRQPLQVLSSAAQRRVRKRERCTPLLLAAARPGWAPGAQKLDLVVILPGSHLGSAYSRGIKDKVEYMRYGCRGAPTVIIFCGRAQREMARTRTQNLERQAMLKIERCTSHVVDIAPFESQQAPPSCVGVTGRATNATLLQSSVDMRKVAIQKWSHTRYGLRFGRHVHGSHLTYTSSATYSRSAGGFRFGLLPIAMHRY